MAIGREMERGRDMLEIWEGAGGGKLDRYGSVVGDLEEDGYWCRFNGLYTLHRVSPKKSLEGTINACTDLKYCLSLHIFSL
jgi:hypothetical protein